MSRKPESPGLDDPIACKVSWGPANPGGASFKAQKMTVSGSRFVIERSGAAILFCLSFALLGLVVVAGGLLIFQHGRLAGVLVIALGVLFDVAAAALLIGDKKIIFDKLAGVYFLGKAFHHSISPQRTRQGRLADIHAIQLVDKQIETTSTDLDGDVTYTSYTSHEMNLVFKDGGRLNVMDHGIEADIEESASQLGRFLGVPIWRQPAGNAQ